MSIEFSGNDRGTDGASWFSGSSRFYWEFTPDEIASRKGFGRQFNKAIAEILIKWYEPYVPYKEGPLSTRVQAFGASDHATVTYQMPYASTQYFGTSFNFTKKYHPLATSYWDKAAWNASSDLIMAEINRKRLEFTHE